MNTADLDYIGDDEARAARQQRWAKGLSESQLQWCREHLIHSARTFAFCEAQSKSAQGKTP